MVVLTRAVERLTIDTALRFNLKNKRPISIKKSALPETTPLPIMGRNLSNQLDLSGARAFSPLARNKRHALVLFERLVPTALNFAVVREKILTAMLRHDKAEAFVVVEPLHNTSFNLQCKS